jgi:phage terminase small subunit
LPTKVKVQALLATLAEERIRRLDISADRILQELARIAFFDPHKPFNQDGSLKNIAELDIDTAAAIAGIEIFRGSKIPSKSREARR